MKVFKCAVFLGIFFFLKISFGYAQKDTNLIQKNVDSLKQEKVKEPFAPKPKLAATFSAVLPGLGQGYNRKYWKIPIVYAGLAGSSFLIYHFHKNFVTYRDEYVFRLDGNTQKYNPNLMQWSDESLKALAMQNQRYMEISIIVLVVWYALNIVDAVVDAHLFSFDVSDNLSMNVCPAIVPINKLTNKAFQPNLLLTFKF